MGLLTTDLKYDLVRTQFQVSRAVDLAKLNRDLREMEAELYRRFIADRIAADRVDYVRSGDLRYIGQGYELKVPLPSGEITAAALDEVWQAFHRRHMAEYGHAFAASPIEIVNVHVGGIGRMPKLRALRAPQGSSLEEAKVRVGDCMFRVDGALASYRTTFYQREKLPVGVPIAGPAIVLQKDSTTLVPPRANAAVDRAGNIIIRLGEMR